ncbi:MAG: Nif3-like dinuclear metal center hexameric protein [Alistipes sp.]|nr:Nif3-like dinuclear metal center hexameric protein [Alistipes sp.]
MKIAEVIETIERFAPLSLQESYDNSGLTVGRPDDEVHSALLAVDVTEDVLDEAEQLGCDIIITHHPIIFHPLKRFNSGDAVQRCVERAIRKGIALYACHTNLDSASRGMSWHLARKLGIVSPEVLEPSPAGCGTGFGAVGELGRPVPFGEFMERIRTVTGARILRHSAPVSPVVSRVALCTGAGSSLMEAARMSGAQVYVTSDLKYNDFYTPDGDFTVVDAGHFESEYCAIEILFDILSKNLRNFAVRGSERAKNPVCYFV